MYKNKANIQSRTASLVYYNKTVVDVAKVPGNEAYRSYFHNLAANKTPPHPLKVRKNLDDGLLGPGETVEPTIEATLAAIEQAAGKRPALFAVSFSADNDAARFGLRDMVTLGARNPEGLQHNGATSGDDYGILQRANSSQYSIINNLMSDSMGLVIDDMGPRIDPNRGPLPLSWHVYLSIEYTYEALTMTLLDDNHVFSVDPIRQWYSPNFGQAALEDCYRNAPDIETCNDELQGVIVDFIRRPFFSWWSFPENPQDRLSEVILLGDGAADKNLHRAVDNALSIEHPHATPRMLRPEESGEWPTLHDAVFAAARGAALNLRYYLGPMPAEFICC